MATKDVLLEIGLEEMPARFVTDSMNQLADKVRNWLDDKKIQYGELQAFSTPRRLTVLVTDVEEAQPDVHEEAKGPARKIAQNEAGEWTKAAIGFTKGQGASVEDIFFKEVAGVEYVHVNKFIKGQQTIDLLPELQELVKGMTFPKNMRWSNQDLRFVRPIKWIVALFGDEVIPMTITNVSSDRISTGHRFLGSTFSLSQPNTYETELRNQYVIVDPNERKESILQQLRQLEEANEWQIPVDPDLLEEVNNLVEFPTALFGKFEEEYLELPEEVLITSMKEHQRYFPVKSKEGTLLPFFVTVRNGGSDHLDIVAKGNEKVLRARLSDADFFYREDQKTPIETSLNKLKSIVYHEEIGTLHEKVDRVRTLANVLSDTIGLSQEVKTVADRAAEICKFDLVTHMVYEFPELQGFMGEKYALQKGESTSVAKAINEHYMPRNAEDDTPSSDAGALLAIADKLDTINSFFAIGNIPSGSQDPYALRRQASGIVAILLNKNWHVALEELLTASLQLIEQAGIAKRSTDELLSELQSFFKLRIKHVLQEKEIRYDVIDAVLGNKMGVLYSLISKAEVLQNQLDTAGFKESVESLSRVLNIATKAEAVGDIDEQLFENEYEKQLFDKYKAVSEELSNTDITEANYFELLVSLKLEINAYFDHTMIMANDEKVKQNRLSQMAKLSKLIQQFANMNEIIVK